MLQGIIAICSNPRNRRALICSKEEKEILASFVSNMVLRNPWSMQQADLDCVTDGIMDVEEIKAISILLKHMEIGGIESLVKAASKRGWLDEDFEGSAQQESKEDLLSVKFCIIKAESGQFVTGSYPVLSGINEKVFGENRVIYFPLHPQFALFYSNTLSNIARNRMDTLSKTDVDFCNRKYIELNKEQARFIYAKEKMVLEQLVKSDK